MSQWKIQQELLPSLVDRLTDLEPKRREEAPQNRVQALRQIKAALRRDLEWLLNTRRRLDRPPEWCKEVPRSLFDYGIPDLSAFSMSSDRDLARLLGLIETSLEVFEPRLTNVVVSIEPSASGTRTLRFQIEAMLMLEPAPERILFDTTLDMSSGEYKVEGDASAR
jgi:type VI secretion system protein ImpF